MQQRSHSVSDKVSIYIIRGGATYYYCIAYNCHTLSSQFIGYYSY